MTTSLSPASALQRFPDPSRQTRRDVDRALAAFDDYLDHAPGGPAAWVDQHVLESSPQPSLGPAVLLVSLGARVSVAAGIELCWDPDYHPAFFRALYRRLGRERPWLSPEPIRSLLEADAFVPEVLTTIGDLEGLSGASGGPFDVIATHSALERVGDIPRVFSELARRTRPGGLGVHLCDYRDQRDLSRPLEHLTMDGDAFQELFRETAGSCGNRWRPAAMVAVAEQAGFELIASKAGLLAEPAYLDELLPRLHPDYSGLDHGGLAVLSGALLMHRRDALNTEYPTSDDSPQTLAHSLCRYTFVSPYVAGCRLLDVGCGAGLGTRELLAAGPASVVGIDLRPEALEAARAADPRQQADAWLQHDLEQGLPFDDGSFDLVVALEVLEHVAAQRQLVAEIERVLSPQGLAFISVPHRPFELFWAELAGESNPYHLHVPGRDEFEELLSGFAAVEFSAQLDLVSSLVLPLADSHESSSASQRGTVIVPGSAPLSDRGSIVLIAAASKDKDFQLSRQAPVAHAWGNHQQSLGGAILHNQNVNRWAEALRHERNGAVNRLAWIQRGDLPAAHRGR